MSRFSLMQRREARLVACSTSAIPGTGRRWGPGCDQEYAQDDRRLDHTRVEGQRGKLQLQHALHFSVQTNQLSSESPKNIQNDMPEDFGWAS